MSTRKMRRGAFALTAIPALVLAIGGTAVALDSNQTQTGSQDNSATQSAIGGNATATQGVAANENTPVITGSAGSTVTNAQSNSVMADASASNSNDATQLLGQSAQSVGGSSTSGASCDQSQVASQTNQATQTATGGTATATQVTATNTNLGGQHRSHPPVHRGEGGRFGRQRQHRSAGDDSVGRVHHAGPCRFIGGDVGEVSCTIRTRPGHRGTEGLLGLARLGLGFLRQFLQGGCGSL